MGATIQSMLKSVPMALGAVHCLVYRIEVGDLSWVGQNVVCLLQGTHLGHGLYGQQQLPLGRQHYQGAGVQDHSSYAYQAPGQGYGGYGRQYGQQYYNQNQ